MYPISFLMPRNKQLWIFIGWYKNNKRETFADNSKYVFLNVVQKHPEIKAIWIADDDKICKILRKRKYEAYSIHSLKGAYYSLRAGYTVIDAVMQLANWRYSGRSKTIQLWHADGIKKLTITHKWRLHNLLKIFNSPGAFKRFHFFIASSEYIRENFTAPSFDVPIKQVKITGLPRYDSFFKKIEDSDIDLHSKLGKILNSLSSNNSEKIILYAPTFRRGRSVPDQLSHLDLIKFNEFLSSKNYSLVISLHPKFSASNWVPSNTYSNIYFSNAGYDFYPLLPKFDVLVTDYSSTCIEFLLLNKPTIFYIYDIEEYRENEGLAEKFWNHMPGPRVETYDQLTEALDCSIETLMKESHSVRKEIFKYPDGNSAERVVQEILKDI